MLHLFDVFYVMHSLKKCLWFIFVVPEITEVPPAVSPLADLTVPEGTPARFVTTVTGTPTPKITWYREGNVVKASRDFQVSRHFKTHRQKKKSHSYVLYIISHC